MPGELTVKVEETRLVLGEGAVLPAEKIVVDHPDDHEATVASFNAEKFPWVTLWLYPAQDGVLNCDVCNFAPKSTGFGKPPPDFSGIRKLVLFHDNEKVYGLVNFKIKPPAPNPPRPHAEPKRPPEPEPPREVTENVSFSVPLEHFRFLDGAAETTRSVNLPSVPHRIRIDVRIENRFFSPKLNCIRPYLAKAFGGRPVEIQATVRVCGKDASVLKAEAPELKRISSELLSQVRFNYVKDELKRRHGKRMTTAERFFGKLAGAGFAESDTDFLDDIIRAKKVKHSEHIEYLARLHDASQIRLRLIRDPFSFLFYIPGEKGSYFVWETIDGTDATYIWELRPMAYYLDGRRNELKRALDQVEQTLDRIHAAGRNEYLQEEHPDFLRIFHDYTQANGLELWRGKIDLIFTGAELNEEA